MASQLKECIEYFGPFRHVGKIYSIYNKNKVSQIEGKKTNYHFDGRKEIGEIKEVLFYKNNIFFGQQKYF